MNDKTISYNLFINNIIKRKDFLYKIYNFKITSVDINLFNELIKTIQNLGISKKTTETSIQI